MIPILRVLESGNVRAICLVESRWLEVGDRRKDALAIEEKNYPKRLQDPAHKKGPSWAAALILGEPGTPYVVWIPSSESPTREPLLRFGSDA